MIVSVGSRVRRNRGTMEAERGLKYGLSVPLADKVANGSLRMVDGAACRLCGFVRRVVRENLIVNV